MYDTGSAIMGELSLAELIRQLLIQVTFGPIEAFFSGLGNVLLLVMNPLSLFA